MLVSETTIRWRLETEPQGGGGETEPQDGGWPGRLNNKMEVGKQNHTIGGWAGRLNHKMEVGKAEAQDGGWEREPQDGGWETKPQDGSSAGKLIHMIEVMILDDCNDVEIISQINMWFFVK